MSRKSKIDRIIQLTQCGWRAYEGQATAPVYDGLGCDEKSRGRARWFAREGPDGREDLLCIGCERACMQKSKIGFQLPLFIYPPPPGPVAFGESQLTPERLLSVRKFLRVAEVARVLNVGPKKIRKFIAEGYFSVGRGRPLRVPVEDVKRAMRDTQLWESEREKELDKKARLMG